MRVKATIFTFAALVAAVSLTGCAAELPAAPTAATPPTTSTTVVVPASWSVPVAPGATCDTSGSHPATFGQTQWDTWLTGFANDLNLPNPRFAPMTGMRIEFPTGCYYVSSQLDIDHDHPLVDVTIDGGFTNDPANAPHFVQTYLPACDVFGSFFTLRNNATARTALVGLNISGSAPDNPPYCGGGSGGLYLGGLNGAQGPQNVSLIGNTIHNTWGDNLSIGVAGYVLVDSNVLTIAGRQSISVTATHDLTVTNNTMEYPDGLAFSIETNANLESVSKVLVSHNSASYANAAGTDSTANNGPLFNVTAVNGTTVSDVKISDNTSKSALSLWSRSTEAGLVHRIAFISNTTTSNDVLLQALGGDNITFIGNKALGGPPDPNFLSRFYIAVPPASPTVVCGTTSDNTYVNSAGDTVAIPVFEQVGPYNTPSYAMPAC